MIVGSLVLILTAAGLLAGGLILGNDWLLGASIVASLFAAVLLYVGARQSASARRLEQAEIEDDDEDWDDDESEQADRRPWGAAGRDPAGDPGQYGRRGGRRSYAAPEYESRPDQTAPLHEREAPARDPGLAETTALDLTGREAPYAAPESGAPYATPESGDEPERTTRIPALYMNTRAGFARYPSNAQVPVSRPEEPDESASDSPPPDAPAESLRHDSGALPELGRARRRGEPPAESAESTEAGPEDRTEQWRTASQAGSGFGAESPRDAAPAEDAASDTAPGAETSRDRPPFGEPTQPAAEPPFGAPVAGPAAAPAGPPAAAQPAADEQDEWVGGGVDEDDPKDEPPIQRRPARVAAAVARLETDVFVIDGRPRYHVAGCVHLLGRESEPLPVGEAVDLGFTPCGLCEPDTALTSDAADNARR